MFRTFRAKIVQVGCVVGALALLLVLAPGALASAPPSWEAISSHVPAEIPLAEAVNQVDTVTVDSDGEAPYDGHFSLELEDEAGGLGETKQLRYASSAATVQSALEAVAIIGHGNVRVTGGPKSATGRGENRWTYTVTFTGALRGSEVTMEEEEFSATPAEEAAVEKEGFEAEEGSVEVDPIARGQHDTITYQLSALNTGGSPSAGRITLTDTLPPGLSTEATPEGSGWTCAPRGWGQSTITCTTDAVVQPGARSNPVTIRAYVDITHGEAGQQLINTLAVSGGGASSAARAADSATAVDATPANRQGPRVRPPATGASQIRALMARVLLPSGRALTIAGVLKAGGARFAFRAPEAGVATIDWYYLPPGAKLARTSRAKPVLVASGQLSYASAGRGKITIRLTRAGRSLLKRSKKLRLTATGSFTPAGHAPITAARALTLGH